MSNEYSYGNSVIQLTEVNRFEYNDHAEYMSEYRAWAKIHMDNGQLVYKTEEEAAETGGHAGWNLSEECKNCKPVFVNKNANGESIGASSVTPMY